MGEEMNRIEELIRIASPAGMNDGVHVIIEYFTGFELFNDRPYHNYETWSGGFRVKGLGVVVEKEYLDDAIQYWFKKVQEKR
jgi:hypothetical protein